jgi:O-antigen ligase
VRELRPRLTLVSLVAPLFGAAATLAIAYVYARTGAQISLGALLAIAVFVAAVIGFMSYPHLAVAATVALFALVPTLKVFFPPEIGAVKDIVVIAAGSAAALLYAFERRARPDRWVFALVLVLFGLYVVNAGGGHGIAWAQGVRLIGEPLILLLVGLTLPRPRRTLRYALGALVITACFVAAYGILQQLVGQYRLVGWGYSFGDQVRTYEGHLRSFGTLDEPFGYAAFLLFGLAAVFFWLRRGPLTWGAAALILLGLFFSYVRGALLILVAFVGLVLRRWGHPATAVLVVAATVIGGGVILANAAGSEAQTYTVSSSDRTGGVEFANVVLNGRISAWDAALGHNSSNWLFGRGVGRVGTAAARASYTVVRPSQTKSTRAVDSGYLATIADVGLVGLAVLVALFGRLLTLALVPARQGKDTGWIAIALLAAILLDALARSSFTGFPTAFLGLLLVGIALAAAQEEQGPAPLPRTSTGT